jgi:hypothetical protein
MDQIATLVVSSIALGGAGIALWMAGAIYYDVCGATNWGRLIAAGWIVVAGSLLVGWQPIWQPFVVLLGVFVLFLGWWLQQKPSHNRDWDPAVAVLPRAVRQGESVTIENVRNFDYRSLDDFTPRYESRTYHLANLAAVDAIFFNWGSAVMSHPVLVFDFGPDGRVCMSIEVRYQRGQEYSILRSLYHFYELIFLVADERDAILRRTKYGPSQEARLYRLVTTAGERRATFLDYVDAINDLYRTPRWYHGLCTNCTTAFYRLPSIRCRCDWRVLVNARLDRALYATGRLDRTWSFPELRRSAYLNEIANAAPEEGFGDYLRRELAQRRQPAAK